MAAYDLDCLLKDAGITRDSAKAGDAFAKAREALAAELDAGRSLVGKSKSHWQRDLTRVAESIGTTRLNPEDLRKRRARGRPRGALSSTQKRKQAVVERAVYFWIRFSPRDLSGARAGPTHKFVEAFYAAATGRHSYVERQFIRAVRPWIDEAKALGSKAAQNLN